jgi:putative photosynthetic complex assembly protein
MSASTANPRPAAARIDHLRAGRMSIPFAVLALGAAVVLGCGAARWSHYATPPAAQQVLATVSLNFADAPDGSVLVRNAATGALIETVPPRGGGFLRSTMRVMATEREADHLGPEKPFTLTAMDGNRLALTDTATGQTLELEAFGPSNAAEFAAILATSQSPLSVIPAKAGISPTAPQPSAAPQTEPQK